MKTLKQWEKSKLDLDEYLGEAPCKINKGLYYYIINSSSYYISRFFRQCGDPIFEKEGVMFYITTSYVEGAYWYLGILPEFK